MRHNRFIWNLFRKGGDLEMDAVNAALATVQTDVAALAAAIAALPETPAAPVAGDFTETVTGTTADGSPVVLTVTSAVQPAA